MALAKTNVADALGVLTQDMRVDAQRHGRVGVAQAGCYNVDRDSGQQHSSCMQVTKIVKPGMRQWPSGRSDRVVMAVDQLRHECSDGVGI